MVTLKDILVEIVSLIEQGVDLDIEVVVYGVLGTPAGQEAYMPTESTEGTVDCIDYDKKSNKVYFNIE